MIGIFKKVSIFKTYIRVYRHLDIYFKKRFLFLIVVILVTSVVDLFGLAAFIPAITGLTNPEVFREGGRLFFLRRFIPIVSLQNFQLTLFLLAWCFFVLRSGFIFFSNWIQNKFVFDVNQQLGSVLYSHYLNSDFEEFTGRSSTDILRELTSNTQQYSRFIIQNLLTLSSELLVVVFIVIGISLYDFSAFVSIMVTLVPAAFLFNLLLKRRMRFYGDQQNALTTELFQQSNRGMFGYIDIKLRSKESSVLSEYNSVMKKLKKYNVITSVLSIMPSKVLELVTVSGLVIIFFYGVFIANDSDIVLPLITVYALAGYRLIPTLSKAIPAFLMLDQYNFLFEIFEAPLRKSKTSSMGAVDLPLNFTKSIKLKNLSFSYKNENINVINHFNLEIRKGEVIGFVGGSGSGKTTLVNLISGFLIPNEGSVLIDEVPLKKENLKSWQNKISYVQQSPFIETGSLLKNIAFLEDSIDMKRVEAAIKGASLQSLVKGKNPRDINIKEFGKNLSGGQKQRILIARALYHNSDLIIFDEATSALDTNTEDEIIETIENLKGTGVTILMIAHRHSTLKGCEKIYELNQGKIIKELKFNELISRK